MKLSVFTVATPDLQPEELAKAAADAGIEGIEWRFKEIPEEAAGRSPRSGGITVAHGSERHAGGLARVSASGRQAWQAQSCGRSLFDMRRRGSDGEGHASDQADRSFIYSRGYPGIRPEAQL